MKGASPRCQTFWPVLDRLTLSAAAFASSGSSKISSTFRSLLSFLRRAAHLRRRFFDGFGYDCVYLLDDQTEMRALVIPVFPLKGHWPQLHDLIKPVFEVCDPSLETRILGLNRSV